MSAVENVRNKLKTRRYRAGQVPEYAREEYEKELGIAAAAGDSSITTDTSKRNRSLDINIGGRSSTPSSTTTTTTTKTTAVVSKQPVNNELDASRVTQHVRGARNVQRTQVIIENKNQDASPSAPTTADDDDMEKRRQRARERFKQQEEEQRQKKIQESEEEEEEESEEESSEEEESEEEEGWGKPMFRPVFIKAEKRSTIKTEEQYEKEAEEERIKEEQAKEQRKQEAYRKLRDELERDKKEQDAKNLEETDEVEGEEDEEKLYDEWVKREIERLKQDIREKLIIEEEEREKERRSKMTDEEIAREDREKLERGPKKQLKFLQRDYHRGAFFQDDEYIKNKDFSEATSSEKVNIELLPKIMQVKNFGKAGRTKYTHLADQDTSQRKEALWNQNNDLVTKYFDKMAASNKKSLQ